MRGILICFEAVSGLNNVHKKVLYLVGNVQRLDSLVVILGCQLGLFPIHIWGSLGRKAKEMWPPVAEKFERRFEKKKYLLKGEW